MEKGGRLIETSEFPKSPRETDCFWWAETGRELGEVAQVVADRNEWSQLTGKRLNLAECTQRFPFIWMQFCHKDFEEW
jgi:hypothetical protein